MKKALEFGVLFTGITAMTFAIVSCSGKDVAAAPPAETGLHWYKRTDVSDTYTVREIVLSNGTKCAVASQGDYRGGISIVCDWKTP